MHGMSISKSSTSHSKVAEHREMIVCVGERFASGEDEEEQVAARLVSLSLKSVRDACKEYLRNMPE